MELLCRLAADGVVVVHLAFILFVFLGGLTLFRWPRLVWIHVPAALWGGIVEFTGAPCPLTPLENFLRRAGNDPGYGGGFVDHYIVPIVYPPGLTRDIQLVLGGLILAINLVIYYRLIRRKMKEEVADDET
jgi:hypothetical protein